MRKEFLETQANKGAAGSPAAAAAPTPKKRGRTSKAAEPVDAGEDDAEPSGTPAKKKQRRGRPFNKGTTTDAKVEAGSDEGDDDEVSLKIQLYPHPLQWPLN